MNITLPKLYDILHKTLHNKSIIVNNIHTVLVPKINTSKKEFVKDMTSILDNSAHNIVVYEGLFLVNDVSISAIEEAFNEEIGIQLFENQPTDWKDRISVKKAICNLEDKLSNIFNFAFADYSIEIIPEVYIEPQDGMYSLVDIQIDLSIHFM